MVDRNGRRYPTGMAGLLLDMRGLFVVKIRYPIRSTFVLLSLVFLAAVVYTVATNQSFQWDIAESYIFHPLILDGVRTTIALTIIVMFLASILGAFVALMRTSGSKSLVLMAATFTWFFRGMPALLQLIFWYNLSLLFKNISLWVPVYGTIYSIPTDQVMTPMVAATVALALNEAGYMAEIIRGGLDAVPKGQKEAALSLGLRPVTTMRLIIFPQAMKVIIPPAGNESISLLKTTSLVSTIAVGDVLYAAQSIYSRTFETMPLLIVVAFWYLAVVSVMTVLQRYLEAYFGRENASR